MPTPIPLPIPKYLDLLPDFRPPPPADWRTPGVTEDQIVYVNPETRMAVRVSPTDTEAVASLVASGYARRVVPAADWDEFAAAFGPNLSNGMPGSGIGTIPVPAQAPMTDEERRAMEAAYGNIDASAAANQENLIKAFELSQPSRDRAALQTKEQYGAAVLPTLAAGAFSGAGYHQPLNELYGRRLDRDRTLAGLADQNTSEQFQLSMAQQQTEAQRVSAVQEAYNAWLQQSQDRYNQGVDSTLSWIK